MLEFLKTKPSYSVDSVEVRGEEVAFLYSEALPVDEVIEIVDPEGGKATVLVESCRRNSGQWLHIGHFQTGSLQPTTVFQEGVRRDTRLEVGLRVRSHQFCGYAAITNDLSENGMQLTLREPVQVATNLELALDFEDESESLEMAGVVRWCQVSAPHRVGIQFVNLTAEQQAVLRNFMQDRTEPQLPGLPDDSEPDEEATSENALRAEVIDAYRQGEIVAIRLKKGEEVLEYRYALPEVDVSDLKVGASIGQIVTEPTEDGLFRYSYIDSSGELVLEVIAAPPEVTVSAA